MHSDQPSEMTRYNWVLLFSLYITQFVAMGFFLIALVAIMREQGYSLESLSVIYLLGLFWVFKFLWAPAIDRWKLPGRGHFRSWLLLLQFLMVVVLLVIAQQPLDGSFTKLFLYCMLLAFLSATQDIAADGLSCSLLLPTERGVGNGVQSAGGLIGNMLGGGGVLILYPWLGWEGSLYLLAAGTSISLILLFFFREPDTRPVVQGVGNVFRYIQTFWKQPHYGGWLRLLLIFPAGIGLAYGLLTPLLVDVGWSMEQIGLVMNVIGSLVGVFASILVGWLLHRYTRRRVLLSSAIFQCAALLALLLPVLGYTDLLSVGLAIGLFYFAFTAVTTVLMTLMMDHASKATPSTDYAMQFGINALLSYLMAAASMLLAGWLGYGGVILFALILGLSGLLLSLRFQSSGADHASMTDFHPEKIQEGAYR
ncbi:MFS transporter [Oceanospirillum linum]|uniref:MFS transporter n=1 Tax=Oceanospirillum linum TaxID=966 RepID=A0A1T1H7Z4_OCELI|nr:MFS transporter [Oceanospirillum linum]OOV85994.1 hypothetical protein BTA35_0215930 [Oceanospirillum linum]SEG44264.1 Predicted arabinose efflux permease, MFS family [Oleiphilus messinensis]SMP34279.1 Predicted arabinose efflux permease, MFS family [Oceanospirillum linum]